MSAELVLLLLVGLTIKHFFVDFPMQKPYQWKNKGTYGHPGGLLHSGLHAIGTLIVLFVVLKLYTTAAVVYDVLIVASYLAVADGVIHYHVDWAKMNINAKFGWGPNTHEQFWTLLGVDQLLHMLTYIGIVSIIAMQ